MLCKSKGKGSPYSITERRVPELIPVLGSQPAGDVSHKPGGGRWQCCVSSFVYVCRRRGGGRRVGVGEVERRREEVRELRRTRRQSDYTHSRQPHVPHHAQVLHLPDQRYADHSTMPLCYQRRRQRGGWGREASPIEKLPPPLGDCVERPSYAYRVGTVVFDANNDEAN